MKVPIIIDENGDISFFETAKNVELYIEPIDVVNNEYTAYDSEGRLLQLKVEHRDSFDKVVLSTLEMQPSHTSKLKRILKDFFTRVGANKEWLSTATLEEFVAEGIKNYKTV